MESGDDTKSRLEQPWITKNRAQWSRVKRLFDKQCIKKKKRHVPIRTKIWGHKSRNTRGSPYLQDSDPRNSILGKKTHNFAITGDQQRIQQLVHNGILGCANVQPPKTKPERSTLKTIDDGHNLLKMAEESPSQHPIPLKRVSHEIKALCS